MTIMVGITKPLKAGIDYNDGWTHLIFISRDQSLKWMTNHREGHRSACKVDNVRIIWCHCHFLEIRQADKIFK